jgi:predicted cobalt transporter CbtA
MLAQLVLHGWGLGEILVAIVVVAACVALVYVALKQFGITIPAWVQQVFWICVCAFVVILAIRLVLSF